MGEYVSTLGMRQFRIAETEKYAHVTFFFNGGSEKVYDGEDRVIIPSPREYPTYDLIPEMSAEKVGNELISRMDEGGYDFYVCNFANCDMVGHTGVTEAAVRAVETVDACLGGVAEAARRNDIILVVTADHGNAVVMRKSDGSPNTAHTTNLVPFVVCGADVKLRERGRLSDVAPTLLQTDAA
jgi:2,3-bisphosphoglycerate-independent phosphoglycerate mutase